MVVVAALPPDMTMELPLIRQREEQGQVAGPGDRAAVLGDEVDGEVAVEGEGAGRDEEPVEPERHAVRERRQRPGEPDVALAAEDRRRTVRERAARVGHLGVEGDGERAAGAADVPVSWSVPASTWTAPALVRLPDRIVVPVEALGDHAGGRVGDRDADRGSRRRS